MHRSYLCFFTLPPSNDRSSIIRTECGLTITGTYITLYDVMYYLKAEYPPKLIREKLGLTDEQILSALTYIDESDTGLSDKKLDYFILASVAIHIDSCSEMYRDISLLKRDIFPYLKPEDWEIRGRNI